MIFEKPVVATPASTLTIIGANFYVPSDPFSQFLRVQVGTNHSPGQCHSRKSGTGDHPRSCLTGYLSLRTAVGWVTNTTDYIYGSPRIEAFTTNGAAGDTINIRD